MGDPHHTQPVRPRRGTQVRRLALAAFVAGAVLVTLALLAPTILSRTALRNVLFNRVLADKGMHGSVGVTSLGWWNPLSANDVVVERDDRRLHIEVGELQLEQSLWGFWTSLPDLGTTVVRSPKIRMLIRSSPPYWPRAPDETARPDFTINAVVQNGALELRADEQPDPLLVTEDVDLVIEIRKTPEGRLLEIAPVKIFDHQTLTPELFDQGLQLVAPLLANSTRVEGQGSLQIDCFQIPLDVGDDPKRLGQGEVRGELTLHQVSASLKDATVVNVARQMTSLFQIELPNSLRLVDNSVVKFELRDGRVHHDGLAFLIPEISPDLIWRTRGSVGLDESLDITVELELPSNLVNELPIVRQLDAAPIGLRILGTIDHPELRMPEDTNWMGAWGVSLLDKLRRRSTRDEDDEDRPLRGLLRRLLRGE